jgi:redox-sensitive bicupin YhaK (pirin superfamily)
MSKKRVLSVHKEGSTHWVGNGFPVRNFFPSTGLEREISPFLMLDYAGPAQFAATETPRGVGEHPHRGFETVTIAYQGSVAHRDSGGNLGIIHPGDVQWMTAGSGVVHEEMHEKEFARKGGTFEMVQLWVNLPKTHKMTKPRYQTLLSADIPHVELDSNGGYIRVIAGEFEGTKGPAQTFTPVTLLDVRLNAGTDTQIRLQSGDNAAVLFQRGSVVIDGQEIAGETRLAHLGAQGDTVSLQAVEDSIILIMSGTPINEPIASYGPFVMNTKEELMIAVRDYQAGRMGYLSPVG